MFGKKSTLNLTLVAVAAAAMVVFGAVAQAGVTLDTIAIHFGANEPSPDGSALDDDEVAGVPDVETDHWNNTSGASGEKSNLIRVTDGEANETTAEVRYATTNTWCSVGCGGEFNNNFTDADRKLMSGYLDQDSVPITTAVNVENLPDDMAGCYKVYIYMLGGVPNRGGEYTVNGETKSGTVGGSTGCGDDGMDPCNGPDYVEDPGADHTTRGNYLVFSGMKGSTVEIRVTNTFGETPRAPINGVQIVSCQLLEPNL